VLLLQNKMNSETVDDQCVHDNLNDSLSPSVEEIENEDKDYDRESKRPRVIVGY